MLEITEEEIESQLEEELPSIEVDATIEKEALDIAVSKVFPPLELKAGKSPPAVTGSVDEAEELKDEFVDLYLDAFTEGSLEEAEVEIPKGPPKGEVVRIAKKTTESKEDREKEIGELIEPRLMDDYGEVYSDAIVGLEIPSKNRRNRVLLSVAGCTMRPLTGSCTSPRLIT